jgi:Tfp pilus assembly protein PilO
MTFNQRERIVALAAILCLGALVGDRLIMVPLQSLWRTRTGRVAELRKSLEKGRILAAREEAMRERWQDMKQRSLPADVSVAENQVLRSLSRWAQESSLDVTSRRPRWTNEEEGSKKLEFRVAAQGRMDSIARFLYELETDPLPLKVEQLEIAARDESGGTLAVDVRFTGLVLMDEER